MNRSRFYRPSSIVSVLHPLVIAGITGRVPPSPLAHTKATIIHAACARLFGGAETIDRTARGRRECFMCERLNVHAEMAQAKPLAKWGDPFICDVTKPILSVAAAAQALVLYFNCIQ